MILNKDCHRKSRGHTVVEGSPKYKTPTISDEGLYVHTNTN